MTTRQHTIYVIGMTRSECEGSSWRGDKRRDDRKRAWRCSNEHAIILNKTKKNFGMLVNHSGTQSEGKRSPKNRRQFCPHFRVVFFFLHRYSPCPKWFLCWKRPKTTLPNCETKPLRRLGKECSQERGGGRRGRMIWERERV